MAMQRVLTEHIISISEFRKNPAEVFKEDTPVAVTSNNQTQGYFVPREMYEQMVALLIETSPPANADNADNADQFRPSLVRLIAIKQACANTLANASESDFKDVKET
ncbi:MAG: hypothetical protein ACNYPE_13250 [Candidatus Azotimanducaceae bacterium WSBS_2022_MAG_OTU7]